MMVMVMKRTLLILLLMMLLDDEVNADDNDDHDDVFGSRFTKEAFVRSCRWPSPNTNGPATAIALCVSF